MKHAPISLEVEKSGVEQDRYGVDVKFGSFIEDILTIVFFLALKG